LLNSLHKISRKGKNYDALQLEAARQFVLLGFNYEANNAPDYTNSTIAHLREPVHNASTHQIGQCITELLTIRPIIPACF